jgi:hypothetical protein
LIATVSGRTGADGATLPEDIDERRRQRGDQIGRGDDAGGRDEARHDERDLARDAEPRMARRQLAVAHAGRDVNVDMAERGEPSLRETSPGAEARMAATRDEEGLLLVERKRVDAGRLVRERSDGDVDLGSSQPPRRQECVDADDAEPRPRHLGVEERGQPRKPHELAGIGDGQRELSRRARRIERLR